MKQKKKVSLSDAAERLASIAEKHLAVLPENEQEARVAAFSRVAFKPRRGTRAKSSGKLRTQRSPVAARARE